MDIRSWPAEGRPFVLVPDGGTFRFGRAARWKDEQVLVDFPARTLNAFENNSTWLHISQLERVPGMMPECAAARTGYDAFDVLWKSDRCPLATAQASLRISCMDLDLMNQPLSEPPKQRALVLPRAPITCVICGAQVPPMRVVGAAPPVLTRSARTSAGMLYGRSCRLRACPSTSRAMRRFSGSTLKASQGRKSRRGSASLPRG